MKACDVCGAPLDDIYEVFRHTCTACESWAWIEIYYLTVKSGSWGAGKA
jgi:hypothetical protein